MPPSRKPPRNIDEYIFEFPPIVLNILQKIQAVIWKLAPGAEEAMRSGIPIFIPNRPLMHFAVYRVMPESVEHLGLQGELSGNESTKGPVRFPLDGPMPIDLMEWIFRFQVGEAAGNAASGKTGLF